jgi:hypothetical protein
MGGSRSAPPRSGTLATPPPPPPWSPSLLPAPSTPRWSGSARTPPRSPQRARTLRPDHVRDARDPWDRSGWGSIPRTGGARLLSGRAVLEPWASAEAATSCPASDSSRLAWIVDSAITSVWIRPLEGGGGSSEYATSGDGRTSRAETYSRGGAVRAPARRVARIATRHAVGWPGLTRPAAGRPARCGCSWGSPADAARDRSTSRRRSGCHGRSAPPAAPAGSGRPPPAARC